MKDISRSCFPSVYRTGLSEDEELHQYVLYDAKSERKGPRRINLDDDKNKSKTRYEPPNSLIIHMSKISMPELQPKAQQANNGKKGRSTSTPSVVWSLNVFSARPWSRQQLETETNYLIHLSTSLYRHLWPWATGCCEFTLFALIHTQCQIIHLTKPILSGQNNNQFKSGVVTTLFDRFRDSYSTTSYSTTTTSSCGLK